MLRNIKLIEFNFNYVLRKLYVKFLLAIKKPGNYE